MQPCRVADGESANFSSAKQPAAAVHLLSKPYQLENKAILTDVSPYAYEPTCQLTSAKSGGGGGLEAGGLPTILLDKRIVKQADYWLRKTGVSWNSNSPTTAYL